MKGGGADPPNFETGDNDRWSGWPNQTFFTGLFHIRTTISMREIPDGTTNTIFVGEKHLVREFYLTGTDGGDNQPMCQGYDPDTVRFTSPTFPPQRDAAISVNPGVEINAFGSPHTTGINFAMCDGSVQLVNFGVDLNVYTRLGNRKDGLPVNVTEL